MRKVTRREFVIGSGALALSPWLISCQQQAGPSGPQTIKIGGVYPLTGNLASTGLDCRRGVELAVEIINGKYDLNLPLAKTEGIPNLGGKKIEMVWADTKGEPKNGQAESERLVTQDKVVGVLGAYQSAVTKTASQATERLQIPFVCSDSSSPTLTERGLKYFFRVSPHDGLFAHDQFQFLKDLEKAKKQKVQTVALLYENTEFGANVGKEEEKYAKEFGYKVVENISYTANATDVSSEVGRLIKAKPDVLMHASYITDAILFTKTFKERGFSPKGFVTMAGYIEPGYLPAVKEDGNNFIIRSTFALDLAKKKPLVGQVNDLFKKKFGIDMSENAARSFTAPFVFADAFNRAKSTAADAVIKALRETDIPGDQVLYPWK
ncbi:MAG: ABC transporter substrate-binding protein, partial [Candidatus Korobacteraceae bacterium]